MTRSAVNFVLILIGSLVPVVTAGPFAPDAGQPGSTAIPIPADVNDVSVFVGWVDGVVVERGLKQIDDPSQGYASHGVPDDALGFPETAPQSIDGVVSLGDGGIATLTFSKPIADGPGYDFAIFENGFTVIAPNQMFLELAFVEVSSDGVHYERFSAISLTQTESQIPNLGAIDTTDIHNFAGKYRRGYGTPFDLDEIRDVNDLVDVTAITHVRLVDVVGTLQSQYASYDALGNIVNDPWKTNFSTGGFDLDAVGVIHEKTLLADINGDGIVNLVDFSALSAAWQSGTESSNWNHKCDLDPSINDLINIDDVVVMMNQWLMTGVSLEADINGDGIVNLVDYAAFSLAWRSGPEDSDWNLKCNLAPSINYLINIHDMFVMMSQWLMMETWYTE
ncbi:MAG: hypothetical protein OEV87_02255 [Phycisphaerae bacterium]|nr:hypothetical protein [Phycisphaerae bacterium]